MTTLKKPRGVLLVVSGAAGTGKGTVNAMLMKSHPEFVLSVSATTRAPRPGEENGREYHFITREQFEEHIRNGGVVEYTEYCGNYYGTPKKEAEEVLQSGCNLLLEIEVEGAANVKRCYPDAVLIMLLPPSFAVQEARLRGRGTETEEKILARLAQTREELPRVTTYDYVIYNRDNLVEEAVADIRAIVRAECAALCRNQDAATRYFE